MSKKNLRPPYQLFFMEIQPELDQQVKDTRTASQNEKEEAGPPIISGGLSSEQVSQLAQDALNDHPISPATDEQDEAQNPLFGQSE